MPHDTPPIELEFELTAADMAAVFRATLFADPISREAWGKARRQYRAAIGIAVVLTALLIVGVATDAFGMGSIDGRPVIAVILAAGATGAWWTVAQYRRGLGEVNQRRYVEQLVRSDWCQYHLGPQRLTVGPDGITLRGVHHDVVQRWSGISSVRELPEVIVFQRRDGAGYPVPRRLFARKADADAFAARAKAWLEASGHGDERRLREYLAAHDAPCPGCGYNLRGVTAAACPECGRELDVGLIRPHP